MGKVTATRAGLPAGHPSLARAASRAASMAGRRAPFTSTLIVFLIYGLWLLGVARAGHDVRDFIHIGHRYAFVPHVRPLFTPDPTYPYAVGNDGYDGQFAYYIALDPVGARAHLDRVNYRYTRILYPMTARLLSLGHAELVPYMLVVINWLAIAAGTLVVALWLGRTGLSPWLSLVYGLSPGLFVCLQRDLEEPLAYALVALAMYLYAFGGRRRLLWSGIAFGLAALTRESTAVFPVVLGLWLALEEKPPAGSGGWRRWSSPALLLAPALAPLALYKAFLLLWLSPDTPMVPPGLYPRVVPLSGILSYWPWHAHQVAVVIAVVVPALICGGFGLWVIRKHAAAAEVWLLLANVLMFVVVLNRLSYENIFAASRVAFGVVLAALLCIPAFDRCADGSRLWLWLSAAFWLAPWPSLVLDGGQTAGVSGLLLDLAGFLLFWAVTNRRARAFTTAWAAGAFRKSPGGPEGSWDGTDRR
ncbi:MAG: hypothetical protein JOZ41_11000 [Chloroflexi bacterium]|nr:hypothetical protein [Chloroflexota bacterium]